jgi:hypothetical protein
MSVPITWSDLVSGRSLDGRGAFRRFTAVLLDGPSGRERRLAFRDAASGRRPGRGRPRAASS